MEIKPGLDRNGDDEFSNDQLGEIGLAPDEDTMRSAGSDHRVLID
jgi:hypothetical protein